MRFSASTIVAALLATNATACPTRTRHHSHAPVPTVSSSAPVVVPDPEPITSEIPSAPLPTTLVTLTTTSAGPSEPAPTEPTTMEPVPTEPASTSSTPVVVETTSSIAAPAPSAPSSGLSEDQQSALDAHNSARAEVGTDPLVWDEDLASQAQVYAEHLASIGSLTHSGTKGQGENLYSESGSRSGTPNLNAANAWLSEKSSYHGEAISSTNFQGFGHYTQMVWKDTTNVGLGVATGSRGTFVVGRYSPPGNFIGESAF